MMRKKGTALLLAFAAGLSALFAGGAALAAENTEISSTDVVVTMPPTSEPEAGFDPAYGWGAGEHVHEPPIQNWKLRMIWRWNTAAARTD